MFQSSMGLLIFVFMLDFLGAEAGQMSLEVCLVKEDTGAVWAFVVLVVVCCLSQSVASVDV
jgi:hypothetical protein